MGERRAVNVTPSRLKKLVEAVDRPGITHIDVDMSPDGAVKIIARRSPIGETDGQEALRRRRERKAGLSGEDARHPQIQ